MTILTTADFVGLLIDDLIAQGLTVGDAAALKAVWTTRHVDWMGGDAVPIDLQRSLVITVGAMNAEMLQRVDFWTGTASGGPHSDGTYDLTLPDGTVEAYPCLAKIMATMAKGDPAGTQLTFSTTTADADPGAAGLRFNHATLASVTSLYVDLTDYYGGDLTSWLTEVGASTASVKGFLFMQEIATSKAWTFKVTGATVTATGYRKIPVTAVAGTGIPANGNRLAVQFFRSGDHGDSLLHGTGAPGSGLGSDGDVYLRLDTGDFYGPKASGAWGSPVLATGLNSLVTTAVGAAASADADATQAALDRIQTVADRTQTGLDRTATAADRVQTGLDRAATGADRTAVAADKIAVASNAATASSAATAAAGAKVLAEAARDDAVLIAEFDVTNLATKAWAKRTARRAARKYSR